MLIKLNDVRSKRVLIVDHESIQSVSLNRELGKGSHVLLKNKSFFFVKEETDEIAEMLNKVMLKSEDDDSQFNREEFNE